MYIYVHTCNMRRMSALKSQYKKKTPFVSRVASSSRSFTQEITFDNFTFNLSPRKPRALSPTVIFLP